MPGVSFRVLQPLLHAFSDSGGDAEQLLRDAGVVVPGNDVGVRLSEPEVARLCSLAVARSDDPALALQAGLAATPAALGVLGYVMQNSSEVRGAWQCLQRYWHLLHDDDLFRIEVQGSAGVLSLRPDPHSDPASRQALIEYLLSFLLHLSGTLIGGLQRGASFLRGLDFRHDSPPGPVLEAYRAVFRNTELRFACPVNAVHFDAALLDQPVSNADPALLQVMLQRADTELAALTWQESVGAQVISVIRRSLPGRAPGLPEAAAALHMSRATLQRRLAAEGTSYRSLLEQVRKRLAEEMLREGSASVGEVAFALGYADTAAFTHAWKRWTGTTPRQVHS